MLENCTLIFVLFCGATKFFCVLSDPVSWFTLKHSFDEGLVCYLRKGASIRDYFSFQRAKRLRSRSNSFSKGPISHVPFSCHNPYSYKTVTKPSYLLFVLTNLSKESNVVRDSILGSLWLHPHQLSNHLHTTFHFQSTFSLLYRKTLVTKYVWNNHLT